MFLAIEEMVGQLYQLKLLNTTTGEYVTILPDFGGNVNQIVLKTAKGNLLSVVKGYMTHAEAAENAGYHGSKLIPFPNRLFEATYHFEAQKHVCEVSRPQEGHAIHGLWHSQKMEVVKLKNTQKKATLHLLYRYKGDALGYPFKCSVLYKYRLSDTGFRLTTEVVNEGKTAMPFGDGWHPYFSLETDTIDELEMTLPPVRLLATTDRNVPTGELVSFLDFFQASSLKNVQLDHGFKLLQNKGRAETILRNPTTNNALCIWQEAGDKSYDYLQVYTPANRKTIAIEPMTCAADAFNNGLGTVVISPKGTWKAKYGVAIRKDYANETT